MPDAEAADEIVRAATLGAESRFQAEQIESRMQYLSQAKFLSDTSRLVAGDLEAELYQPFGTERSVIGNLGPLHLLKHKADNKTSCVSALK